MRATAIAEAFRHEGKTVLLLIDSLTRVAHAQREIGLTLGEPPTMKGYPPSVFALIPSLCDRAGIDRQTGGSVTALYTVLAAGGESGREAGRERGSQYGVISGVPLRVKKN